MDVMELGAIGELVGGVAVIASLAFVGLQIRANTQTTAAAAQNAWVSDYKSMLLAMGGDPEWMEIYRKGLDDFGSLSRNDQARVHVFLGAHMLNGQNVFEAARKGQFDRTTADGVLSFCASIVKTPGLGPWWASFREYPNASFVARIESDAQSDRLVSVPELLPWYGLDELDVRKETSS